MATIEQRDRVRAAAAAIGGYDSCAATSVVAPETEPRETWVLEATIYGATVPPELLRELAIHELEVLPGQCGVRANPTHVVLAAAP